MAPLHGEVAVEPYGVALEPLICYMRAEERALPDEVVVAVDDVPLRLSAEVGREWNTELVEEEWRRLELVACLEQ